ncbi:MAG: nicotinamidase-related amidase [Candidatus Poriferisodalaceae bacterium]|jgi:nicotinamidase-related amidase
MTISSAKPIGDMKPANSRAPIEGQPVLVVIDIQGGESDSGESLAPPFMPAYGAAMDRAPALIEAARACDVPIVFFQEAHRRNLIGGHTDV